MGLRIGTIALSIIIFSTPAFAYYPAPPSPAFHPNYWPQPEYYPENSVDPFVNLRVRVNVMTSTMTPGANAVLDYNRKPLVVYNPHFARFMGTEVMGQVLQHEYCHHELGHLKDHSPNTAQREADADCCSAYYLVEQGKSDILRATIQKLSAMSCSYAPETPISQVTDNHPCWLQRARILRYCAAYGIKKLPEEFFEAAITSDFDTIEVLERN